MHLSKLLKAMLALTVSASFLYASACNATPKAAARKTPVADAGTMTSAPARTVELKVTDKGYEPSPITLKKGEPVKLVVTRTTEHTCATEIIIDKTDINVELPLNKPVEIAFTPKDSGELKYGCHMGKMLSGVFLVQ
jgi:plastocyanin domain-containing protein